MDFEYWRRIPGWFHAPCLFRWAAASARPDAHFVEVGCWLGRSTAFLAAALAAAGKPFRLDCVDTFRGSPGEEAHASVVAAAGGSIREQFEANLSAAGLLGLINVVECDSAEAASRYAEGSLDFVFLDAAHDHDSVRRDILAWRPRVRPGGVLAGDDYSSDWPGVVRAVNELLPQARPGPDNGTWVLEV
jgi:predicted O-methyltransferase YrrM